MAAQIRDDFSERIKRTVAERAAYICAICRRPTVGPHSDPEKSLKTGEACHINAAASGGPRYSSEQTNADRSSIENAIWLCTECSTRIDKDEASYSDVALQELKQKHEFWVKNGGIVPSLPNLSLTTLDGRTLPEFPATITANDCNDVREHLLRIQNVSDVEIQMIEARVQVPEPIIQSFGRHKPVGVSVGWQPMRPQMVARITGGGTVTRGRPPLPTNIYQLQIDRLPPSHFIELDFTTSTKINEEHDLSFDTGPFAGTEQPPFVRDFIKGTYQFQYQGAVLTKPFFAPLKYDKTNRRFMILEIREDVGEWQPLFVDSFS